MRDTYHDALDSVTDQLVVMIRTVGSMIERASAALLEVDLGKAESVIAAGRGRRPAELELELARTELLALQQPVATDLRIVTGALRMSLDHRADGRPRPAHRQDRADALPRERRAGRRSGRSSSRWRKQASMMGQRVGDVIADQNLNLAFEIEQLDDRLDELTVMLLQTLMSDWPGTVDQAVDVTLMSRFYERFADHAVSMARRIVFTMTGTRYDELEKS